MTDNVQRRAADLGYAMVEIKTGPDDDAAAPERHIDELRQYLNQLRTTIDSAHDELADVESQARKAVDAEDAEQTASLWNTKRQLLDHISELQKQRHVAQQRLETDTEAAVAALIEQRADIERDQAQQDADWAELIGSVEGLLNAVREIDARRGELKLREQAWRRKLEALAGRDFSGLAGAAVESSRKRRGRSAQASRGASADDVQGGTSRLWSVYDPDSGRLVASLPELSRLLARWYPNLRTEEERVREFLTIPNSGPMPASLRRELEQAGYLAQPGAED